MFLPQSPYFPNGSLIEQIIYPMRYSDTEVSAENDALLRYWIKKFGLDCLLDKVNDNLRLNPDFSWDSVMSLGEFILPVITKLEVMLASFS
jgi:ABC-type uncharacterized transport system fused permease/ATPase subunit